MDIGILIKSLRNSLGWQQNYLAEKLGITTNYLSLIENGKRIPSKEVIERFAKEAGVSVDALEFLSTDIPDELDKKNAELYKKLQENVAGLLLFQGKKVA